MTPKEALAIIELYSDLNEFGQDEMQLDFDNALRFIKRALTELEELKATVKELLDIPFTVSTVSGTSLLIKTMNKLEKLVGDKDE